VNDAWANFIAGLNPITIEHERMRPPDNPEHERPGSTDDKHMRSRHTNVVAVFYAHPPATTYEDRIAQQREADIRAYARRHNRKAAA
jgi:hypothetical protein